MLEIERPSIAIDEAPARRARAERRIQRVPRHRHVLRSFTEGWWAVIRVTKQRWKTPIFTSERSKPRYQGDSQQIRRLTDV
jgi:hypothetical protein